MFDPIGGGPLPACCVVTYWYENRHWGRLPYSGIVSFKGPYSRTPTATIEFPASPPAGLVPLLPQDAPELTVRAYGMRVFHCPHQNERPLGGVLAAQTVALVAAAAPAMSRRADGATDRLPARSRGDSDSRSPPREFYCFPPATWYADGRAGSRSGVAGEAVRSPADVLAEERPQPGTRLKQPNAPHDGQ
jgi:hypothetical protein